MINLSPPRFFQRFFKNIIWNFPDEKEGVFLTFDDGPTQGVTPWVLDQLARYNAKATFFCLAKNVEMNPDIFERVVREGHAIGNHSYSHIKGWRTDTTQYIQDVIYANSFLHTNLYRPPYGRITARQFRLITYQYKIVLWDVLSMDYSRRVSPKKVTKFVIDNVKPGSIVVFHDSLKAERNLRYALPRVLDAITATGMVCKPIVIPRKNIRES
ncbi:MAG: polysaccharide deacetylase family protein [Bacteroidales bacterium]|nr:polysaccharide deacetylase family protein [Bacteroidales bacterium]